MASLETATPARVGFSTFALAAALLVSIPLVLGFFGRLHPALDAMTQLRAHLAALLAVVALVLLSTGPRLHGLVALLLGAGAFATTLPASTFHDVAIARPAPVVENRAVYRLLHLNLRFDHAEPGRVLSLIARERPDVLTLNEVSALWRDKLDLIAVAYPYRLICRRNEIAGGVAILSRRPLIDEATGGCDADGRYAAVTVDFGGQPAQVVALHLERPWPWGQAAQIAHLVPLLAGLGEATIVGADLNATPWSTAFSNVVAGAGFSEPLRAGPTWLSYRLPPALRPLIGVPIDHVLTKPDVSLHALRVLDDAGSDHLPVLAEFSIRPAQLDAPMAVAGLAVRTPR